MKKKNKEMLAQLVDPLDSDAAISDFIRILRNRGMSTTDLAIELGWTRNKTDEFLYGVDIPLKSEFEVVALALEYTLEFEND